MASFLDTSKPVYHLYISGVIVDFSKSKKNIESAEVRISDLNSPTPMKSGAGKALRQTFSQPVKLSLGDMFSLHVRYKRWYGNEHEDIGFELDDMFRQCSTGERQEYNKVHKNIAIVVKLSRDPTTEDAEQLFSSSDETLELRPITDELFRKCPQFRILVIGKTGVGKSSLINHAFGVQNATTSHDMPGEVSIDHEFISPQNNKFVLHDSKGFEPGEKDNLKIVRDFIDHRRKMPCLKDQLHAVWWGHHLSGRLLETGVEQFLTSKREGELGNIKVPIVAVFTKYDTLLGRVERTLDKFSIKGLSKAAIQDIIKKNAEDKLQEVCVAPLEKFAKSAIPHVTVSTNGNHEETLARLIQTTEELRVDPGLKIKASIEVGKRKYWKAFTSSVPFKNRSMWDCLHVLHTDIVNVWNFRDPNGYLCSPEFRGLMANMVNELDIGPTADANQNLKFGLSIVGTIAGIASALAGPAAPIIVPIAVSVVVVKWVHEVYQQSCAALLRFMEYIIDLTLVLQTLYLLSENQELSRRAIKLAVKSYHDSPMSGGVHNRIQEYDRQLILRKRADRDSLDQLIELLQSCSISAKEVSDLRGSLPTVDLLLDEPWDTVEKS
ncbi:hypothetical protein DFJ58DRAFT_742466 [Suillus subalutaceus]|uniref:uncharacterized protein n=1 Tax=Suillus subalutaceus TaxID=48586 RepID=UPI001B870850|nr:uncharacterized protein DFJ58DRAFT_742466 [Suillus subalutaceus]KAG1869391.1 hypothetical protein DFJ58DRAFT_742466 [Suillus subalutaceus]